MAETSSTTNAAVARRVLLVTGASRGIGAATARLAAAAGWDVAVNYLRDEAAAAAVVRDAQVLGARAIAVRADVSSEAQVDAMFARVDAELGVLEGLVNNAGIVAMGSRFEDTDVQRWRTLLEVNVIGAWRCAQRAVRRMSPRHGGAGGSIVNISSIAAVAGGAGMYVDYAASKGAIDTFTVGLARELAADGVRVNAVRPGIIDTEIHAASGDAQRPAKVAATLPMRRPGRADEVAQAVLWLLSPAASYVTGAVLDVGGGR